MDGVVSALQNFHRGLGAGGGVTYELGHKGNHEVEETDGLDESETKNGVGEELATEGGVAGNTVEEGGEDETDTNTGTGKTDGSGTHTKVLGDLNHGLGDLGRVGALLESLAGGGVDDGGHLGALEGLEGGAWRNMSDSGFAHNLNNSRVTKYPAAILMDDRRAVATEGKFFPSLVLGRDVMGRVARKIRITAYQSGWCAC